MDQNIVFQVCDHTKKDSSWGNSEIVYVLKCVPSNYDVTDIVDAISAVLGSCTIRYARLELNEKIDLETTNGHNGGYYQHHKPR